MSCRCSWIILVDKRRLRTADVAFEQLLLPLGFVQILDNLNGPRGWPVRYWAFSLVFVAVLLHGPNGLVHIPCVTQIIKSLLRPREKRELVSCLKFRQ